MENILEVSDLKKTFYKGRQANTAVDGVSFYVKRGSCVGLVGESGSGKSTIARLVTRLIEPDSGKIRLQNMDVMGLKGREQKRLYQKVQMVFQSPQDSFDPRRRLGDSIMEGMRMQGVSRAQAKERTKELLAMVELDESFASRFPHEVSGGQCQRAAIARAIATNPELLICDEATSALDVTVQSQIIDLLGRLREEMDLSILMICHDLALVQHFCDYVLVMYHGKIVEHGTPEDVIRYPKEEYTKELVEAAAFGFE